MIVLKSIKSKFYVVFLVLFLSILLALSGCIHLVSYYDSLSYKNLTDLKGEMKVFFEKASKEGAHGESDFNILKDFKIKISQAYEYEKGKKLNDDTIAQFEDIDNTVNEVLERYLQSTWENGKCTDKAAESPAKGCLTTGY